MGGPRPLGWHMNAAQSAFGRNPNTLVSPRTSSGVANIPVATSASAAPGSVLTFRSVKGALRSVSQERTFMLSAQPAWV
jgi:hypothetical protein